MPFTQMTDTHMVIILFSITPDYFGWIKYETYIIQDNKSIDGKFIETV